MEKLIKVEIMEKEKPNAPFLPVDVLTGIFKYLDTGSKGKAAQVCTSWKKALDYKSVWKTAQVKLRSGNLNIHSEYSIIKKGIKRFDVCILEPRVNDFLRRVPNLEQLRFIGCCVKQNMRHFFDTLRSPYVASGLAVHDNNQAPEVNSKLFDDIMYGYEDYHDLNGSSCWPNTGLVLQTFTMGMKQLKILHLEGCSFFGDEEIPLFADEDTVCKDQLTSLRKLCLRNFWPVNEKTVDYLSQRFVNLVSLNIEACHMDSHEGFVNLPKLEKLEHLSFMISNGITDAALNTISKLLNLTYLDLGFGEDITDSGLEIISRLKNLVTFRVIELHVTDEAFGYLNQMPCLRELALPFSTISDTGLIYLAGGNLKLTKLDISCCRFIGDQGLLNICQSRFVLRYLNVSSCVVTDYGVGRIIEKFSCLQVLHVDDCRFVSYTIKKFISANIPRKKNLRTGHIRQDHNRIILSTNPLDSRLETILRNCQI